MRTPPPTTKFLMPIVKAVWVELELYLKQSWVIPPYWTISVNTKTPLPACIGKLINELNQANKWEIEHMPKELIFEKYFSNSLKWTAPVKNNHLLYSIFYLISNET